MIRGIWLLALGLLLVPSRSDADETYLIKTKDYSKGDISQQEKNDTKTSSMTLLDGAGKKVQERDETKSESFVYRQTILINPKEGKKPSKLRRRYEKAEVKIGDDQRTLPYQGKTVLIEKKGSSYHFQIEGGEEITGPDAEALNEEFNRPQGDLADDKFFLPKKPVRINETWKIDTDPLIKSLGKDFPISLDTAKIEATGKLLKAYKKEGHQFGEMEIHTVLPIKSFDAGGKKITVEGGSKVTLEMKLDGCIDGSLNEGKGQMNMDMNVVALIDQGGNKFKLTLKASAKGDLSEKEVPKK
jgi:hypothetical protein